MTTTFRLWLHVAQIHQLWFRAHHHGMSKSTVRFRALSSLTDAVEKVRSMPSHPALVRLVDQSHDPSERQLRLTHTAAAIAMRADQRGGT
jgi:hypothetical protein